MTTPSHFDMFVRSAITGLIALIIVAVAAIEALRDGTVQPELAAWGGIIIGVFFGSHASMNGSAVRAARDQAMLAQLTAANSSSSSTTGTATDAEATG